MSARLTSNEVSELMKTATQNGYSDRDDARDAARQKIQKALVEAYREADESVILRDQLNAVTREKLILEQERRELTTQASIGDLVVVYAPLRTTTRADFDATTVPANVAIIFTDDLPEPDDDEPVSFAKKAKS